MTRFYVLYKYKKDYDAVQNYYFLFEYHYVRERSEKVEFRQVKNHHQRDFTFCAYLYTTAKNNLSITEPLKFILIGNYKCTVKIEIQISSLISLY